MGPRIERVKNFFDQPFYLERSRRVIAIRSMIVQEFLGPIDHSQILDLGCGDGSLSIPLLRETNEVTMVDLSSRMLEIAASRIPAELRNRVQLINLPLQDFLPSTPYDVVLCIGVLAHVPSIEGAIEKIAQCLRPGAVATCAAKVYDAHIEQPGAFEDWRGTHHAFYEGPCEITSPSSSTRYPSRVRPDSLRPRPTK